MGLGIKNCSSRYNKNQAEDCLDCWFSSNCKMNVFCSKCGNVKEKDEPRVGTTIYYCETCKIQLVFNIVGEVF